MSWIGIDYAKCSGCRLCEIACSIKHEGKIWPEASRIRVFMLVPGLEIPHFCVQCHDHPCIESCPVNALSVNENTGAILVDRETCVACGDCIEACPGRIPHMHPIENYPLICDLCGGEPECVKICTKGHWNALFLIEKGETHQFRLYARKPKEVTKDIAIGLFGEKSEELI